MTELKVFLFGAVVWCYLLLLETKMIGYLSNVYVLMMIKEYWLVNDIKHRLLYMHF